MVIGKALKFCLTMARKMILMGGGARRPAVRLWLATGRGGAVGAAGPLGAPRGAIFRAAESET